MIRKILNWLALGICLTIILVMVAYGIFYATGYRINDTRSVAKGLYRISKEIPKRGSYVTFCPPDTDVFKMARKRGYIQAGFCPNNYSGLMKFIAGMPGDYYRFSDEGLQINGRLINNTKPLMKDGIGQPLPIFKNEGRLNEDEYILIGNAVANSFDARYYGIIKRSHILNVVKPVWIEEL